MAHYQKLDHFLVLDLVLFLKISGNQTCGRNSSLTDLFLMMMASSELITSLDSFNTLGCIQSESGDVLRFSFLCFFIIMFSVIKRASVGDSMLSLSNNRTSSRSLVNTGKKNNSVWVLSLHLWLILFYFICIKVYYD